MKNIGKKLIALAIASCMVLPVLAGCGDDKDPCTNHVDADNNGKCDVCGVDMPAPAEVKITDGVWSWGSGDTGATLKLKEDGTFYFVGVFKNDAGAWELKNEETKYHKWEMGTITEGEDETEYTAAQKLVLTAYSGTVYSAAYDDGVLWNCKVPAGMDMTRTLRQNATREWNAEEDETAIELVKVCDPKDANANLVLYHDKTFADQTDGYTEGVWEQTSTGYSLKDEEGNAHATVTKVAEGKCTYTPAGGTAVTLYETAWTAAFELTATNQSVTLKGKDNAENVTLTLKLWDDASADVTMTDCKFKISNVISGSWERNANGTITLTFGTDTATVSAPDGENKIAVTLTIKAGDVFASDVTATLNGVSKIKTVSYEFTATDVDVEGIPGMSDPVKSDFTLALYADKTVELKAVLKVAAGMNYIASIDNGTYTVTESGPFPSFTITLTKAGALTVSPDYSTATATGVTIKTTYTAEDVASTVNAFGNDMEMNLTFTAQLAYAYTIAPTVTVVNTAATKEEVTVSGVPGVGTAQSLIKADLYSDNTVELYVTIFGNKVIVDTGTYSVSAAMKYTFTFEKAGELEAPADYATATTTSVEVNLTYTAENVSATANMQGTEVPLSLSFSGVLNLVHSMA